MFCHRHQIPQQSLFTQLSEKLLQRRSTFPNLARPQFLHDDDGYDSDDGDEKIDDDDYDRWSQSRPVEPPPPPTLAA